MEDFVRIYGPTGRAAACKRSRKALAVYIAVSVAFVLLCVLFALLYRYLRVNVWLCGTVNVLLTVAFLWFSLLFFSAAYPPIRADVKFYKDADNALIRNVRGVFRRADPAADVGMIDCVPLVFDTAAGETTLYVRADANVDLTEGGEYDLRATGDRLLEYRKVDL